MKTVKFVKPHSPYTENDIAGIPDKEAEELIEAGVAVVYKKGATTADEEEKVEPQTNAMDEPAEDKMVKSPVSKK